MTETYFANICWKTFPFIDKKLIYCKKNIFGSHANEESSKGLAKATSQEINADASNRKSMDETSEIIAKADQNSAQYHEENCQG
jgi:hypothetical protein